MIRYPILSAKEIINALKRIGFAIIKQKGSHVKLSRHVNGRKITTIVPYHKTVMPGTLKGVLELAEVTLEKLLENL
ncbi:MAG: type II toxin-antitoxin system HicA family toxin [Candidatus Margulisiibacteriota bacterium]